MNNKNRLNPLVIGAFAMACAFAAAGAMSEAAAALQKHHDEHNIQIAHKALSAGAVCERTGETSFRIVDPLHDDRPFYALKGEWSRNDPNMVVGMADTMEGTKEPLWVFQPPAYEGTCHLVDSRADFPLKPT
jgi:hypothetical protein